MDIKPYSQSMIARFLTCRMAMKTHLESGGRMMLTRTATPKLLRTIASEFTGKEYAASKKGMTEAYTDLCNMEIVKIPQADPTEVSNAPMPTKASLLGATS